MLMAASVTMSGPSWLGTSMTKQWLIRRAVRRPPSRRTTAAINSSVCRLPFISASASPALHQRNRLGRGRMAVRRIDDDKAREILAERRRGGRDPGLRPDEDGFEEPERHRLEHRAEGSRVAGMRHRDLRLRKVAGGLQQPLILLVPLRRRRRLACESCHHIDLRSIARPVAFEEAFKGRPSIF